MNADYIVHGFHRLGYFWSGPKVSKKPPKPTDFGLPSIHPGFLNVARILMRDAIPWPFDWQLYELSDGDRRYSSVNRGGARLPPGDGKSLYVEIWAEIIGLKP